MYASPVPLQHMERYVIVVIDDLLLPHPLQHDSTASFCKKTCCGYDPANPS